MAIPNATTISLTAEDRKIVRDLQKRYEREFGKLTVTGVVRVALRDALSSKKA